VTSAVRPASEKRSFMRVPAVGLGRSLGAALAGVCHLGTLVFPGWPGR